MKAANWKKIQTVIYQENEQRKLLVSCISLLKLQKLFIFLGMFHLSHWKNCVFSKQTLMQK